MSGNQSRIVTLRISESLFQKLKEHSKKCNTTVSGALRLLIENCDLTPRFPPRIRGKLEHIARGVKTLTVAKLIEGAVKKTYSLGDW